MERGVTDIAIVGIGCRFPGGVRGPAEYWRFMTARGDGVVDVPAERWNTDLFYDPDPHAPGRAYTRRGGFLATSPWEFDPDFFGIAPREAMTMDPQQRLVLEVGWEAFDDAGIAGRIAGGDVGVYVGGFMTDNQIRRHIPAARTAIDSHTSTSGTLTMLSNRLSHVLDLRGPSMTIDTACSSSLVAVHEAAQALVRGECAVALAGGVNVMLHPETFVSMCKGRLLSPDGRSKSFDAAADGYGRGEGAGMVVLKPVGAALRDGDRIYAVIRGTGVNQDGRTTGITVPNLDAQRTLALRVCAEAGIDPGQVGYVEAHGTGTVVGDPIELSALGAAFGTASGRRQPLVVGSVKAAIGHLEAAAGIAGLVKAALVVHNRTVVPQAWLNTLNPVIPFDELNVRVPTDIEPFPAGYDRVIAAVNSFGYGGTNAHVVLEEAPKSRPPASRPAPVRVFPLSGASEQAVRALAAATATLVSNGTDPDSACAAAWTRRAHHQFRAATPYQTADGLVSGLAALAGGDGKVSRAVVPPGTRPVFVFSGMGPQWWRMSRDMLQADGVFARTAAEIDSVFTGIAGWSIVERLLADEETSRVTHTEVAQPANFLVQVCLAAELAAAGVAPAALVGHSVGEVSAAYLSGSLSLSDALLVSFHRARLQSTTEGTGGMLAAGLSETEAKAWITKLSRDDVCVAAANGPTSVTLSGGRDSLELLRADLEAAGAFVRPLRVTVPYHSAFMDPILPELATVLDGVRAHAPSLPLYSTVTGARADEPLMDAAYWCDNVRRPVCFAEAVRAVIADGHRVFLEVGPHPVLGGNIREMLVHARETGAVIATLRREADDRAQLEQAIGELYLAGCLGADAPGIDGAPAIHVDLPPYPWQHTRLFSEAPEVTRQRTGAPDSRPLLGDRVDGGASQWQTELSTTRLPWLRDHVVDGMVLLPGAAYLDAMLCAAAERGTHPSLATESVRFSAPLVVNEHDVPALRLRVDEATNRVTITSRAAGATDWAVNCTGRIVDAPVRPREDGIPAIDAEAMTGERFYERLAARGLRYGPAFRRVVEARVAGDTVVATIEPSRDGGGHLAHPAVTDAAFQSVAALDDLPSVALVPAGVGTVRWFAPVPDRAVTAVVRRRPGAGVRVDITIGDGNGTTYLELVDVAFAPLTPPHTAEDELDRLYYELRWQPREGDPGELSGRAVVAAIGNHARAQLVAKTCHVEAPVGPAGLAEALRGTGTDAVVVVVAGQGDPVDLVTELVAAACGIQDVLDGTDGVDIRAVLVTEGAFRLPGDRHEPDMAHAALAGARRSLRNEQPAARWRLVDLEPGAVPDDVHAELFSGDDDGADEVCLRQGMSFAPHTSRTLDTRLKPYTESVPLPNRDGSFELVVPRSRLLADLALRVTTRVAPAAGEVEVRMDAIGLNNKDVMKILGVLTEEHLRGTYFATAVGMEGVGVVTRAGADSGFAPGDQVLVSAHAMFRRHLTVSVSDGLVVGAPPGAAHELAGSLVPLFTAHYGLTHVARLTEGETVLVHGAAGGTGLAAIQVARALGARVIGSAGTEERRAFAHAAGAHETVDSRSLGFVDDVLSLTGGRGADVVFTSLPGEALRQNLKAAAEFGRIVEIGKTEIHRGGVLELTEFDRNLSFHSVDMDRMFALWPEASRLVADEVLGNIESGTYSPLPTTVYDIADLPVACEAVARSSHMGRVVVDLGGSPPVLPRRPRFAVRPDAAYLVTGGFGAFGLAIADWLVAQGARHLVLTSRGGATSPQALARLRAWQADGIQVAEECADVADPDAVREVAERAAATMPPVRGIFHAAGVLDDRPFREVTVDSLHRVMAPKLRGAWNLHAEFEGTELDAFVLCSSVAALIGLGAQIGYAAANAGLDALAELRRARGKTALSVNWGALGGGGMAESSAEIRRYLDLVGVRPIPMARAAQLLHELLGLPEVSSAVVVDIDWNALAPALPASRTSTRFAEHVNNAGAADGRSLRAELAALPVEQRAEVLSFVLAEQLATVLGTVADKIDHNTPLPALGLDSLLAVELTARVGNLLGGQVSALEFSRGTGLGAIARHLASGLEVN